MLLHVPDDALQVTDPVDRAAILTQFLTRNQRLTERASALRRQAIIEARDSGLTLEQIGSQLGVTPGRVHQMWRAPTKKRLPDGAEAVVEIEIPEPRADIGMPEPNPDEERLRDLVEEAAGTPIEPPVVTALYRYFDDQDRLLYVGITDHLMIRTRNHIRLSSWMDFAARSTIVRYPNRKEAEDAEHEAILSEHPLFNSRLVEDPAIAVRLVEYLIEHGRTDLLIASVSRG
ncbi:hypothetical protein Aph01nite_08230 [Acrocarpospora phusangensis]|uniref:GIY-YIG domain-containing protein n=1 Tax=Acrocarpospora phusangensis TaxID=1070424 RepID=A0A919Q7V0_9ACTN|nr:hypothetical protein [Acrocarpospora phusangensis]GIH22513.1 hypothetical protein Aph01nite_08230 [Acrocarpospora phusangensis]